MSGRANRLRGLSSMREQQFIEALRRVIRDAADQVGQPTAWIEVVQFRGPAHRGP
jgi:hypothetical protein